MNLFLWMATVDANHEKSIFSEKGLILKSQKFVKINCSYLMLEDKYGNKNCDTGYYIETQISDWILDIQQSLILNFKLAKYQFSG